LNDVHSLVSSSLRHRLHNVASIEDAERDARRLALEPEMARRRAKRDALKEMTRQWETTYQQMRSNESKAAEEMAALHGQSNLHGHTRTRTRTGSDNLYDDNNDGKGSNNEVPYDTDVIPITSTIMSQPRTSHQSSMNIDSPRGSGSGSCTSDHDDNDTTPMRSSLSYEQQSVVSSLLPSLADEDLGDFEEEDSVLLVS
jgi:hypothetical protein